MTSCWACETALEPQWKFCIQCGVPVETEAATAEKAQRTVGPLALFGWIIGGIGLVLVAALAIIYFVSR